jgi:hypothetical protein
MAVASTAAVMSMLFFLPITIVILLIAGVILICGLIPSKTEQNGSRRWLRVIAYAGIALYWAICSALMSGGPPHP